MNTDIIGLALKFMPNRYFIYDPWAEALYRLKPLAAAMAIVGLIIVGLEIYGWVKTKRGGVKVES